jgi:type III restriction enzyme
VYFNKSANQFRKAIEDLDPVALIGLTATPHKSTSVDSIVFHYPLADAIADGYVKVPVLVARRDGKADLRTQLADGCALLTVKEQAMRAYVKATNRQFIQPLLFVVASSIDEASHIRDVLSGPDYLGADERVLLITSDEPDDVIAQLDTLEHPGSPVKAVVSVQMLGIGWDVKNVYVIAAVRALESDLLTEQILGRGLRLPFGRRTGVPMLDTVEVLSHHAFSDLLAEAKVLLAQTLGDRADDATATATVTPGVHGDQVNLDSPTSTPTVTDPNASVTVSLPGPAPADNPDQGALINPDGTLPADTADQTSHDVVGLSTVDARLTDGKNTTEALTTPAKPRTPNGTHLPLYIPKVTYRWVREPFSLTHVNLTAAESQGAVWADDNAPTLKRKVLNADRADDGTVSVHISDSQQSVQAATLPIPFNEIEDDLVKRLMRSNAVEQSVTEYNAAVKIARAFLTGAQVTPDTPWRAEHGRLATEALVGWINTQQTAKPATLVAEVNQVRWPDPPDVTETQKPQDRQLITSSKQFVRGYPYSGWNRSFYDIATFDSYSAEFRLAETLDTTPGVKAWQRITNTVPLTIPYRHGATDRQYTPDFIVIADNGVHWIVEGKADSEMTDQIVLAKRDAAKKWVDAVNADPNVPAQWAYLLLSESVIKNAPNWAALKAAGQAHG